MCACGITATVISPELPTEEQLYSIQRIVFKPVKDVWETMAERIEEGHDPRTAGPHSDSLEELIKKLSAQSEGTNQTALENQIAGLVSVLAEHYRDEGPSVTIVPRCDGEVVALGVLDYVESSSDAKRLMELVSTNRLRIPAIGPLERWPEEIEIIWEGDVKAKRQYKRADKALAEKKENDPALRAFLASVDQENLAPLVATVRAAKEATKGNANKLREIKKKVGERQKDVKVT